MHRTRSPVRFWRVAIVAVAAVLTVSACEPAGPSDIGWEGPSYEGASGSPSGSKPESKVWFNDGIWWADLWDTATADFYIHRLDVASQRWIRTSTRLDTRSNSRSDTLWDGAHLYVASHAFAEGSSTTPTGQPAELRRFSYQPSTKTYALDPGFPVQINDARTETLVIEKDSLGRIWATWVQNRQIMVAVSDVGGTSFAAPFALPVAASAVSSDDISSVLAFGGNRIGIMWSNENDEKMYFSQHLDAAPPAVWTPTEVAFSGPSAADDHINLKNVVDQDGRILAAVKTSASNPTDVLVHLLDRDPVTGTWTSHPYGLESDGHTRPIVVVDRTQQRVHMFATSGNSGGSIYEKTAPLSDISFPAGKGTAVLTDVDSDDINNATSTKQPVDATTGLVVVASNDTTRQYWTHYDPLTPPAPVTAPVASFTAGPTSGPAPLDVTFSDTSSGQVTSRSWTFGDGATSTGANPTHRYVTPGTYSVSLRVTNSAGSDTTTKTDLITVGNPPPGPITFTATADAMVRSTAATRNYGGDTTLRTRGGDPTYASYLRFDVSGLTAPPSRARLRIWVTDASRDANLVQPTATSWTESGITFANAPPGTGDGLAPLVAGPVGAWVEVDVTAAVTGNGPVGLRLGSGSTDSALFASRETAQAPQLIVTR